MWAALIAPPIVFLVAIVIVSVYFGVATRGDAQAVAEATARATPYILLIAQLGLAAVLAWAMRAEGLTWRGLGWSAGPGWRREALIGGSAGIGLGLLYVFALSPLLAVVQRAVGDYVPPGELMPALGSALPPFFLANVVVAPLIEEGLYRGYAIPRLAWRFGPWGAWLISSLCFGLLHWAGGFWYIVLTGLAAGGVLGGLFVWRRSLTAAYAAHLALNLVEFLFVWMT
jgi:membrane protease YdiL (CAAX protease family)